MRSWETGERENTLHELSKKFDLDIFVIDRLARSEGFHLAAGSPVLDEEPVTDPNASTIDLDPDRVREAVDNPDPNPEWDGKDRDTGIWRKKPTGEWELINKKS